MAVSTGAAILGAAGLGAVTGLFGGKQSSDAAKSAAQTQADAANNATAANNYALDRQLAASAPWRTAGEDALNRLLAGTQPGGAFTKEFSYDPFKFEADPGYAFRLKQGNDALNATAAARGGLISGNALKAGQDYGQGLASQEYQNSFNRYLSNYANAQNTFQLNRNNLLDPLKFLSNQGQSAAAGQANAIGGNASNNAALSTGAANALAAGQVGSANAWSNALGGIGNAAQSAAFYNAFSPRDTSAYGTRSGGAAPVYDYSSPYGG